MSRSFSDEVPPLTLFLRISPSSNKLNSITRRIAAPPQYHAHTWRVLGTPFHFRTAMKRFSKTRQRPERPVGTPLAISRGIKTKIYCTWNVGSRDVAVSRDFSVKKHRFGTPGEPLEKSRSPSSTRAISGTVRSILPLSGSLVYLVSKEFVHCMSTTMCVCTSIFTVKFILFVIHAVPPHLQLSPLRIRLFSQMPLMLKSTQSKSNTACSTLLPMKTPTNLGCGIISKQAPGCWGCAYLPVLVDGISRALARATTAVLLLCTSLECMSRKRCHVATETQPSTFQKRRALIMFSALPKFVPPSLEDYLILQDYSVDQTPTDTTISVGQIAGDIFNATEQRNTPLRIIQRYTPLPQNT